MPRQTPTTRGTGGRVPAARHEHCDHPYPRDEGAVVCCRCGSVRTVRGQRGQRVLGVLRPVPRLGHDP